MARVNLVHEEEPFRPFSSDIVGMQPAPQKREAWMRPVRVLLVAEDREGFTGLGDAVKKLGASVIIHGDDFDTACEKALEMAAENGRIFIHPYDDPEVIIGQATIALELFRQAKKPIDHLFVCIGGGGMAAGMALVSK